MNKILKGGFCAVFAGAVFGCSSVKNECLGSEYDISCRDSNYVVPAGEIWKLTWESPYKPGDVTPAYDVRVLGKAYTSRDKSTILHAHASESDESWGLLNIWAGKSPAAIWVGENTEFYIANSLIMVHVEAYHLRIPDE